MLYFSTWGNVREFQVRVIVRADAPSDAVRLAGGSIVEVAVAKSSSTLPPPPLMPGPPGINPPGPPGINPPGPPGINPPGPPGTNPPGPPGINPPGPPGINPPGTLKYSLPPAPTCRKSTLAQSLYPRNLGSLPSLPPSKLMSRNEELVGQGMSNSPRIPDFVVPPAYLYVVGSLMVSEVPSQC